MTPINPHLFMDIESGGFDLARNPLLEVGWCWTDHAFDVFDSGTIKIHAPVDCVLRSSKDQVIPEGAWIIEKQAADVNGWDSQLWDEQGAVGYRSGISDLYDAMARHPINRVFAHNKTTEERWLGKHAPLLTARIPEWECTMAALRAWYKVQGIKPVGTTTNPDGTVTPGQLTLAGAGKLTNHYARDGLHGALQDCLATAALAKFLKLYKKLA